MNSFFLGRLQTYQCFSGVFRNCLFMPGNRERSPHPRDKTHSLEDFEKSVLRFFRK